MSIDLVRIPHNSSFSSIITCTCGHDLGGHSAAGCDRREFCRCHRSLSSIVYAELEASAL